MFTWLFIDLMILEHVNLTSLTVDLNSYLKDLRP